MPSRVGRRRSRRRPSWRGSRTATSRRHAESGKPRSLGDEPSRPCAGRRRGGRRSAQGRRCPPARRPARRGRRRRRGSRRRAAAAPASAGAGASAARGTARQKLVLAAPASRRAYDGARPRAGARGGPPPRRRGRLRARRAECTPASTVTGRPAARSVADVTGPIETTTGGTCPVGNEAAVVPTTVEDEVNTTASAAAAAAERRGRRRRRDRPVRLDDLDLPAEAAQTLGHDVARDRRPRQEHPAARERRAGTRRRAASPTKRRGTSSASTPRRRSACAVPLPIAATRTAPISPGAGISANRRSTALAEVNTTQSKLPIRPAAARSAPPPSEGSSTRIVASSTTSAPSAANAATSGGDWRAGPGDDDAPARQGPTATTGHTGGAERQAQEAASLVLEKVLGERRADGDRVVARQLHARTSACPSSLARNPSTLDGPRRRLARRVGADGRVTAAA